jgi:hypothetical protein
VQGRLKTATARCKAVLDLRSRREVCSTRGRTPACASSNRGTCHELPEIGLPEGDRRRLVTIRRNRGELRKNEDLDEKGSDVA